jgi:hypothetical protein
VAGTAIQLQRPNALQYDLVQVDRFDLKAGNRGATTNLTPGESEHWQWDGGRHSNIGRRYRPMKRREVHLRDP